MKKFKDFKVNESTSNKLTIDMAVEIIKLFTKRFDRTKFEF